MNYKVGDCLKPNRLPIATGCAIVTQVIPTAYPKVFAITICTDYGNTIYNLTNSEIDDSYEVTHNQSVRDWFNDRQQLTVGMYHYLHGLKLL